MRSFWFIEYLLQVNAANIHFRLTSIRWQIRISSSKKFSKSNCFFSLLSCFVQTKNIKYITSLVVLVSWWLQEKIYCPFSTLLYSIGMLWKDECQILSKTWLMFCVKVQVKRHYFHLATFCTSTPLFIPSASFPLNFMSYLII